VSERKIEIQSCSLKFFLDDQNSDHAWIKGGGWKLLNVETVTSGYEPREIVWLTREVEIVPVTVRIIE
jgi:hypothetical protein